MVLTEALVKAARAGDVATVEAWLNAGGDANTRWQSTGESVAQSNIGIGKPKSINYYFGRPDHLLKNSARARYAPDVTTVTRATAFYRAPRVSPAPGSPQRRA